MSEFSLDDILDKYGHKDGGKTDSTADDILSDILGEEASSRGRGSGKSAPSDPYMEVFGSKKKDPVRNAGKHGADRTETEEKRLQAEKKREEQEKKARLAEEKKREEQEKKARLAEEKKREEQEKKARLAEEKKREEQEKKARLAEEKKREEQEKKARLAEEKKRAEDEKKRAEKEQKLRAQAEKRAAESSVRSGDEVRTAAEDKSSTAKTAEIPPKTEKKNNSGKSGKKNRRNTGNEAENHPAEPSVVLQDAPIELPARQETVAEEPKYQLTTEELKIEKALRAQKIEVDSRKLLIKDTELEDPDDFLNSLNPYDLGKKSDYTRQIENISASQLSGDTKGVDSETLKRLSLSAFVGNEDTRPIGKIIDGSTRVMPDIEFSSDRKALDPDKIFEPNDDIKEFVPRSAHDTKEVRKHTPEEERFLENINNTIEKKRLADKRDTGPVTIMDSGPFDKIIIPTRNFKVESAGNKVFNSAEIPKSDPEIAEQKLKELSSKRKRRLSNFVLEDISDDEESLYDDSDQDESVDDESGIWTDLIETQKSLRLRYVLLLMVTIAIVLAEVLQRIFIQQKIGLFGNEAGLLDSKSLVIAEMVCGVIGMVLCSSVIFNGVSKLFRARADCDSVCAVSCVVSLAASVLNLMDTNDLQQGRAFVYIPVAMLGLLFNSIGKLGMIKRAKKNYRFISSDVSRYYAEIVDGQSEASALTKGVVTELPYLVTMRKTELFTDFLKKSYCEDAADRASRKLVPVSVVIALIMGLLVYFVPNGYEVNGVKVFDNNIYWAGSVFTAFICAMAPFSMMFMVNNPFRRATKALLRHGSTILGYTSAEEFGETNAVMTDASALFPKSAVECTNIKPCKLQNSLNSISLDMAIILAASLAVSSDSVISSLLFDMIGAKRDMLVKIDGCVYEDDMGVMGWYENKRLIMGNREHMKHHSIKIPDMSAIAKYSRNGSDAVYLAVGGELAVIFFIRLTANPSVRAEIKELTGKGVSVVLKTTDSLITKGKITELFDIDPEKIRIIGSNLHGVFSECTSYTASGCGAFPCTGSFVSLAKGVNASKKLLKDIGLSRLVVLTGLILGTLFMIFMSFSQYSFIFSPAVIVGWNLFWMIIMLFLQCFRRY